MVVQGARLSDGGTGLGLLEAAGDGGGFVHGSAELQICACYQELKALLWEGHSRCTHGGTDHLVLGIREVEGVDEFVAEGELAADALVGLVQVHHRAGKFVDSLGKGSGDGMVRDLGDWLSLSRRIQRAGDVADGRIELGSLGLVGLDEATPRSQACHQVDAEGGSPHSKHSHPADGGLKAGL